MRDAEHMHPGPASPLLLGLFVAANVVIALGYAVLCVAWLRLLPLVCTRLTRCAMGFTAVFFGGGVGTHVLVICHPHPAAFWVMWLAGQAAGMWGAILTGALILRAASRVWHQWESQTPPGAPPGPGGAGRAGP